MTLKFIFLTRESVRAIRGGFVRGMREKKVSVEKMIFGDTSLGPDAGRNAVFKGLGQNWGVGMPLGRRRAPAVAV